MGEDDVVGQREGLREEGQEPGLGRESPMSLGTLETMTMMSPRSPLRTFTPETRHTERKVINELRREVEALRAEKNRAESELRLSREREDKNAQKYEEAEARKRAESLKIEGDALNRAREMRERHEVEMVEMRKAVEAMRERVLVAEAKGEELTGLRDEVDVLRHARDRLEATEEQLRRARKKLEIMGDAREMLTREEEAHGVAVDRALELENELKALAPLRRQLEDYKNRSVDSEVKLAECQENLENLRRGMNEVTDENRALKDGVFTQREEADGMRKRLLEEGRAADDSSSALGEGIR